MEKNAVSLNEVDLARRKFLVAAGGAGAIGAVVALMGRGAAVEAATMPTQADAAVSGGYRETEHIRKYYYCAGYW